MAQGKILSLSRFSQNKKYVPKGFWRKKQNQLEFMKFLAKDLFIEKKEDWYRIKISNVIERGGSTLLKLYGNSFSQILTNLFPNVNWEFWKFQTIPKGFWIDKRKQREFMEWVAKELSVHTQQDWYRKVKTSDIIIMGGGGLLEYYQNSLLKTLQNTFEEMQWHAWKFPQVPKGYWERLQNQTIFFDWLGNILNCTKKEDWYFVSTDQLKNWRCSSLLYYYRGSLCKALEAVYPQENWIPWKFLHIPNNFWQNLSHQRAFFDWIGNELGIKHFSDWYSISCLQIEMIGGKASKRLLSQNRCASSAASILMKIFPEYNWNPWIFKDYSVCTGYWNKKEHIIKYLQWLEEKLNISEGHEWQEVTTHHFNFLRGSTLLQTQGGLPHLLSTYLSELSSNKKTTSSKGQSLLYKQIQILLPYFNLQSNFLLK